MHIRSNPGAVDSLCIDHTPFVVMRIARAHSLATMHTRPLPGALRLLHRPRRPRGGLASVAGRLHSPASSAAPPPPLYHHTLLARGQPHATDAPTPPPPHRPWTSPLASTIGPPFTRARPTQSAGSFRSRSTLAPPYRRRCGARTCGWRRGGMCLASAAARTPRRSATIGWRSGDARGSPTRSAVHPRRFARSRRRGAARAMGASSTSREATSRGPGTAAARSAPPPPAALG